MARIGQAVYPGEVGVEVVRGVLDRREDEYTWRHPSLSASQHEGFLLGAIATQWGTTSAAASGKGVPDGSSASMPNPRAT